MGALLPLSGWEQIDSEWPLIDDMVSEYAQMIACGWAFDAVQGPHFSMHQLKLPHSPNIVRMTLTQRWPLCLDYPDTPPLSARSPVADTAIVPQWRHSSIYLNPPPLAKSLGFAWPSHRAFPPPQCNFMIALGVGVIVRVCSQTVSWDPWRLSACRHGLKTAPRASRRVSVR